MVNLLFWGLIGVVLAFIFFAWNPQYLHKRSMRRKPPMMQKWWARHPNGETSTIESYYVNENQKTVWKFSEAENEVVADMPEDVLIDSPGAWTGDGFFIFRYNRDGSETGWINPDFARYFSSKSEEAREKRLQSVQKLSLDDYDRFIDNVHKAIEDEKGDRKFMEALIDELNSKRVEDRDKSESSEVIPKEGNLKKEAKS